MAETLVPAANKEAGPEAKQGPVFVIGDARSGTTLLYSVILASGAFPIYRAESRIMECAHRYGRLIRDGNFKRFATDYLNSRQFARSGLEASALWEAPITSRGSYTSFLGYFMDSIAEAAGKTRWVEKSPNHLLFMRELARAFPDARFVHAVRDGRDVALSQRRLRLDAAPSESPLVQLIWAARHWEMMVRRGRRHGRSLDGRYMEVRYEDLVTTPEQVLPELSRFIGAELSLDAVRESGVGALSTANSAFGEELSGISQAAKGRWVEQLSEQEKRVMSWAIGRTLAEFGYPVERQDTFAGVPLMARAHARISPLAFKAKRLLNRYTPVGRRSRRPLEMGLT